MDPGDRELSRRSGAGRHAIVRRRSRHVLVQATGEGNQGEGPVGQATVPVTELPDFVTWYVTVLPL